MTPLPPPLVPADCNCRTLPYMPFDVVRFLQSELVERATPEEGWAALLLWAESWLQEPAASLPDDDRILAKKAQVSLSAWRSIKDVALWGWVKCDDGRLYHAVVAEKALRGWLERLAKQRAGAAGNATKHKLEFDPEPFDRRFEEAEACFVRLTGQPSGVPLGGKRARTASDPARTATENGSQPARTASENGSRCGPKSSQLNTEDCLELSLRSSSHGPAMEEVPTSILVSHCEPEGPMQRTAPTREGRQPATAKPARQKPRRALPDQFPGEPEMEAAQQFFGANGFALDVQDQAARFRAFHLAKGSIMADWTAAWLGTWCRNAVKFAAEAAARQAASPNPGRSRGGGSWSALDQAIEGYDFAGDDR